MTETDRTEVQKILTYRQPKCPGCGETMRLDVTAYNENRKPDYVARYICTRCKANWQVKHSGSFGSAYAAASAAYNLAITRAMN